MAIIKKTDVMPERPVIMVIYGTAGCGKTSLCTSADTPLLIDTDRGYDRAVDRVDTVTAQKWEDINNAEILGGGETKGLISGYKTIVVDTAKACIDDFLCAYVIAQNYKLANNSLKRFGEMADRFKAFVNVLRSNGKDLIFVCHDKETAEGDIIRHSPDCTGQSKDLLIRIADEVGYVHKDNGRRVIDFEPTDTRVGKNVAGMGQLEIPEFGTAGFDGFAARIIRDVKDAIQSRGGAQQEALKRLEEAREKLAGCKTAEDANGLMETARELAKVHRRAFMLTMIEQLKERGIVLAEDKKSFVSANADGEKPETGKTRADKKKDVKK